MEEIWGNINLEYKGQVGQAVVDLGITHRTHTHRQVSTKAKESRTQESKATYGAAVDPFTLCELDTLRGRFHQALWPN
eukprot:14894080-Heterocapsa_arctica.AAC.1